MTIRRIRTMLLIAAALAAVPRAAWAQPGESTPAAAAGGEQAANAAMESWTKQGQAACEAKQPACAGMDKVLFDAAAAYTSAHRIDLAMAARKLLIDPRYHLDATAAGQRALLDLARNHHALAEYDEAATRYELFARKYPKEIEAPEALMDAVVFRFSFGQADRAIEDAGLFSKNYGAKLPARVAQIGLAVGSHFVDREAFADAKKHLASSMAIIDKSGTIDVQILAHTRLGRSLAQLGDAKGAELEYSRVRALWKDPAAVVRTFESDSAGTRRLGSALTSLGEALFFFAEQKRREVEAIHFPGYRGPGTKESVATHIQTKVGPWVGKKREAIAAAEKEYMKILQIQPMPPPQWVVASSARVGQMWGRFVAEFRAAPIPKEWKQPGSPLGSAISYAQIRASYYQALDSNSEPLKLQAKAAYKMCADTSVKYQYADAYSRSCHMWLAKNYRKEFPLVDEFLPRPGAYGSPPLLPSPMAEPGQAPAPP